VATSRGVRVLETAFHDLRLAMRCETFNFLGFTHYLAA